jgi:hypothetical protein
MTAVRHTAAADRILAFSAPLLERFLCIPDN